MSFKSAPVVNKPPSDAATRATIEGWRWDYLTPEGWFPSSCAEEVFTGRPDEAKGWYVRERATCLITDHHAPHAFCVCGLYAIEHLSEDVAVSLDELDAKRELIIESGQPHAQDALVIALSRVRLTEVLPGPGAFAAADPPDTIRGHRKEYLEVLVDREWPTNMDMSRFPSSDWWPPTKYVPDLPAWVRQQCADDLEAYLDEVLP